MKKQLSPTLSRRNFLIKSTIGISGLAACGLLYGLHRWKYIIIHHSAGSSGDLKLLQKVKQQRQGRTLLKSMAYHFAIGNGKGMNLGQVVHDLRWNFGLWGTHVSVRNAHLNLSGIGICLIGNYETRPIPEQQYSALVNLTTKLMKKYQIPPENVLRHGAIKGEKTLCPGKYFPKNRFQKDIMQGESS